MARKNACRVEKVWSVQGCEGLRSGSFSRLVHNTDRVGTAFEGCHTDVLSNKELFFHVDVLLLIQVLQDMCENRCIRTTVSLP